MVINLNYGHYIKRYNRLTSYDSYPTDGPYYHKYFGKIHSQDLHVWYHLNTYDKGSYYKNPRTDWSHFYKALHNPTSTGEKIVGGLHNTWTGWQNQLWVLYNIKNYYWR